MNVLVINAGSSSLKYQLINVETHTLMAKGICERVGSAEAFHKHGLDDNEVVIDAKMADHDDAMALVLESLVSGQDADRFAFRDRRRRSSHRAGRQILRSFRSHR